MKKGCKGTERISIPFRTPAGCDKEARQASFQGSRLQFLHHLVPRKWVIIVSTDQGQSAGYFRIRVTGPAAIGKNLPLLYSDKVSLISCWCHYYEVPEFMDIMLKNAGHSTWNHCTWTGRKEMMISGKMPGIPAGTRSGSFLNGLFIGFLRYCATVNPEVPTVNPHIRVLYVFFVRNG